MAGAARPLGESLEGWNGAQRPARRELCGRVVLLRPLDVGADLASLYAATHPPEAEEGIWDYLFEGPFENAEEMGEMVTAAAASQDPLFFAVVPRGESRPLGLASYLRIEPGHGSIEIGNLCFGSALQRTTAASEAVYLLARQVFDELGYRRLEWKCNALNAPSRRAAERFGFRFEGVFRKHYAIKGRNRDTAWFAIVDDEWPAIRAGFEAWLKPGNFDAEGRQRRSLERMRLSTEG